jgi:hypothetical protein
MASVPAWFDLPHSSAITRRLMLSDQCRLAADSGYTDGALLALAEMCFQRPGGVANHEGEMILKFATFRSDSAVAPDLACSQRQPGAS